MKAFPKTYRFNNENPDTARHQQKMWEEFKKRLETKHFDTQFTNRQMFFEFRAAQMIDQVVAELFDAGDIELLHQDTCYTTPEVIETEYGPCLCLPMFPRYQDVVQVTDEYIGVKKKTKAKE